MPAGRILRGGQRHRPVDRGRHPLLFIYVQRPNAAAVRLAGNAGRLQQLPQDLRALFQGSRPQLGPTRAQHVALPATR